MEKADKKSSANFQFATRINYELKRAERYRIFVSLVVFNFNPVLDTVRGNGGVNGQETRDGFLKAVKNVISELVREVDAVSNSGKTKIGILCPETPRQGAEAAARRIQNVLSSFCSDFLDSPRDILIPVEISSFPDAAGARSIASFSEDFV